MGNITTGSTSTRDVDELPARIGARLGAQRVELFNFVDATRAQLTRRWIALGHAAGEFGTWDGEDDAPIPLAWFPWSLGNIKPEEYMFIRNAGALAVAHDAKATIADIGMSSALHLPVMRGVTPIGAVCAYWSEERSSWVSDDREVVCSWAREALSPLR